MARSKTKKAFHFIHLCVGLTTGLIVFIISITGSIYAFKDELFSYFHQDVEINNATEKRQTLPLATLWNAAQQYIGEEKPIKNAVVFQQEFNRNWEFTTYEGNEDAWNYFDAITYDDVIYVNPYTAEIAGVVHHKFDFFHIVLAIHWNLLLNDKVGQKIVGTAVLLFIVSLISGLIIWFPEYFRDIKSRLRINWRAKAQRINNDIHRTLGIYTIPLALIVAITGLVWAFKTVQTIVYVVASMSVTPPQHPVAKATPTDNPIAQDSLINSIEKSIVSAYPDVHSWGYYLTDEEATKDLVSIYIRPNGTVYHDLIQQSYDKFSGKLLSTLTPEQQNRGERLIRMNYDIHVGQILGFGGKILAFVLSLACAMLPVTGFYIWWGKRKVAQRKIQNTLA